MQKAGESRVAFMQRVTGRPTPEGVDVEWVDKAFDDIEPPAWAARVKSTLTPSDFVGQDSGVTGTRAFAKGGSSMTKVEYMEWREVEFPMEAVVADQPDIELQALSKFAKSASTDQYAEMAKIVIDDLNTYEEFGPELPTPNELMVMSEKLDLEFYDKWVVGREAQFYGEGTFETSGLGKPVLFKRAAKAIDRAFAKIGAHGVTASRPVVTPGETMITGTNPRALTQTLVADMEVQEMGIADFAALQKVVRPKVPVLQELEFDLPAVKLTPFDGVISATSVEETIMELKVIPLPVFDLEEKMDMVPESMEAEMQAEREVSTFSREFEDLRLFAQHEADIAEAGGAVEEGMIARG